MTDPLSPALNHWSSFELGNHQLLGLDSTYCEAPLPPTQHVALVVHCASRRSRTISRARSESNNLIVSPPSLHPSGTPIRQRRSRRDDRYCRDPACRHDQGAAAACRRRHLHRAQALRVLRHKRDTRRGQSVGPVHRPVGRPPPPSRLHHRPPRLLRHLHGNGQDAGRGARDKTGLRRTGCGRS